jgi:hypothetical protein
MRTTTLFILAVVVGAVFGSWRPGWATVGMQEEAKGLGYPSEDCDYCHTFSGDHMRERAEELGITSRNCYVCHGAKLPLAGFELYNRRGRYLVDEKARREAERADMSWLADYVEETEEDQKPPPR